MHRKHATDVLRGLIKENSDIFAKFLDSNFDESVKNSKFLSALKQAIITPVFNTFSLNHVYLRLNREELRLPLQIQKVSLKLLTPKDVSA